jgi:hypothetical protein
MMYFQQVEQISEMHKKLPLVFDKVTLLNTMNIEKQQIL